MVRAPACHAGSCQFKSDQGRQLMGRYTVSGSGADCKSAALGSGGSTPSLPTNTNEAVGASYFQNVKSSILLFSALGN